MVQHPIEANLVVSACLLFRWERVGFHFAVSVSGGYLLTRNKRTDQLKEDPLSVLSMPATCPGKYLGPLLKALRARLRSAVFSNTSLLGCLERLAQKRVHTRPFPNTPSGASSNDPHHSDGFRERLRLWLDSSGGCPLTTDQGAAAIP